MTTKGEEVLVESIRRTYFKVEMFEKVMDVVHHVNYVLHRPVSDLQCYKLAEDPGNKRTDATRDDDLILDLCPSR